ncbi:MAG TPA: TMEM175 family protein [Burkholderiales bacterium]
MGKSRLEAFSDGVIAVIITIMVLELKVPHGENLEALSELWPVFLSYVLSFVNVALYWNNHHHLFHAAHKVTGSLLWANAHWLFWMSLIPFTTAWMSENHFAQTPVALYGAVLLMCAVAYTILSTCLTALEGEGSTLEKARGRRDPKEMIALAFYLTGIVLAFFVRYVSLLLYLTVAIIWIIPDRRIEKAVIEEVKEEENNSD